MPPQPSIPSIPGRGSRQQRAAQLKAEMDAGQQADAEQAPAAATGPEWHFVKPGETLADIAATYDVPPSEIWEHPRNQEVRSQREVPSELQVGDALYLPGQSQEQLEPVGQGEYVVREGDSMPSIARDKGYFWKTIWDDPGNSNLRELRQDPNVLLPGDRVTIPEKTSKQEPGETEMRHRFVRRGEPAALNLRMCVDDEPLANQPYVLVIDEDEQKTFRGTTDADGKISKIPIPGNARKGVLTVGEEAELVCHLLLGHMSPKNDVKGVQRRLANLGYSVSVTGKLDSNTQEAIQQFQRAAGVGVTGELDAATEEALRAKHGC